MKSRILLTLCLACGGWTLVSGQSGSADQKLTGDITTKLQFFDFSSGTGTNKTSFLERYHIRRGWGGDTRSGLFMDVDLNLNYQIADENRITITRFGEGQYQHGGKAAWDTERYQFSALYNYHRSAAGGLSYLFSPNQVPGGTDPTYFPAGSGNTGSPYMARFNDDANRFLYNVSRFSYGLGFQIKPGVLGERTTLALDYSGYLRYGKKFQPFVLGGSDVQGATARVLERWRAIAKNIDENSNRLSLALNASPNELFNLAYTGTWEQFDNRARDYTFQDLSIPAPYNVAPGSLTRPLGFTPDSTLTSHALRLGKSVGNTNLGAGYGWSQLEQDSFTRPQATLGYATGRIATENAFFNFDSGLTPTAGVQGFVKYGRRGNDSSYPVTGLIDGRVGAGETLSVRTNSIESVSYGLAAVFRPQGRASTVTVGWKAEDKSRDLTYHAAGIIPSVSLIRGDTETDELYVKLSSRALERVAFRLTSSYAWADQTGLVSEPSKALGVKAAVTYTAPSGTVLNAYYNLKDRENDNNTFTDKNVATPRTYTQNASSTIHAAGSSVSFEPADNAHAHLSLDWTRQDASVHYYESSRRRFESTTTFALRDLSGSSVDNYTFSAGADFQLNGRAKLSTGYQLTLTDGTLASGAVAAQLFAIDDTLDSAMHSLVFGLDYALSKTRQLRLGYTYDRYKDSAYPLLSGTVHAVTAAFTFKL